MKKFLFALVFVFTITQLSQAQTEKSLGDFNELKVYDRIEVALIKADENKIIIKGQNTEDVVIVNKNGKLKVKMSIEKLFDGNETSVEVYYKQIDVIDVNEGAFVGSNDVFSQFEIDLNAQEGGSIKLMVDSMTYLEAKSVTGGVIRVSGTTEKQNVDITTGGSFLGEELVSESAKVIIRAAGEAHINATEKVDAKVRAGGSVYVYGNPKELNENTVFGGKIIRKD
ncbi:head GIN domain-containing protein [Bizionia sp. KMM 8389]